MPAPGSPTRSPTTGCCAQLADGATLVLQGLHRTWPPLVDFGSQLADELGHPVQINAYITPPQNRGFAPHYDVHDVFVLQVSGRKRWRIHEPVVPDPLRQPELGEVAAPRSPRAAETEPLIDTVLEPGDALYLPRGTIHAAEALGETSIHLTVGIHPVTRYTLRAAAARARPGRDRSCARRCRWGSTSATRPCSPPQLDATVAALRAHLDARRCRRGRAARRRPADASRPVPSRSRRWPSSPLPSAIDRDTPLRLRGALRVRVDDDAEHVTLALLDRTRDAAGRDCRRAEDGAVRRGVHARPSCPASTPTSSSVVARRLLREGVIVPG